MTAARAEISIRHAQAEDTQAIRALLQNARLSVDAVGSPSVTHQVALHDKKIVGVAALEAYGEFGLLRSVAGAAEWQRRGIAAALVQAIEQTSGQVSTLYLFTETAQPFFENLGFSEVQRAALPAAIARTSQALGMCPVSETAMCRKHSAS